MKGQLKLNAKQSEVGLDNQGCGIILIINAGINTVTFLTDQNYNTI